jgi:hypothetical protein
MSRCRIGHRNQASWPSRALNAMRCDAMRLDAKCGQPATSSTAYLARPARIRLLSDLSALSNPFLNALT